MALLRVTSRRRFLGVASLAAGALLAACQQPPAPTAVPPTAAPKPTDAPKPAAAEADEAGRGRAGRHDRSGPPRGPPPSAPAVAPTAAAAGASGSHPDRRPVDHREGPDRAGLQQLERRHLRPVPRGREDQALRRQEREGQGHPAPLPRELPRHAAHADRRWPGRRRVPARRAGYVPVRRPGHDPGHAAQDDGQGPLVFVLGRQEGGVRRPQVPRQALRPGDRPRLERARDQRHALRRGEGARAHR